MQLIKIANKTTKFYHKPSMYVEFDECKDLKCNLDCSEEVCPYSNKTYRGISVDAEALVNRYLSNANTEAIVLGGKEPLDSKFGLIPIIESLRNKHQCDDDVVIYTGYTEQELEGETLFSYPLTIPQSIIMSIYSELKNYKNIIVKFGRHLPNQSSRVDDILQVELSSDNQYAKIL